MDIKLGYVDLVLKEFLKLKSGEFKHLDKEHKNYQKFVETIKTIIDENLDTGNGIELSFNEEYTRVYKTDRLGFESPTEYLKKQKL